MPDIQTDLRWEQQEFTRLCPRQRASKLRLSEGDERLLDNSNLYIDPEKLIPRLAEQNIECNFNNPHQPLVYLCPVEHIVKLLAEVRSPLLPMWSATTRPDLVHQPSIKQLGPTPL